MVVDKLDGHNSRDITAQNDAHYTPHPTMKQQPCIHDSHNVSQTVGAVSGVHVQIKKVRGVACVEQ
jgi:hypothetical protein